MGSLMRDGEHPHIVLEVIATNPLLDKLLVYDGLAVPEVWLWRDGAFELYLRRGEGGYDRVERSHFLPELDLALLAASSPARTKTSPCASSRKRSVPPAELSPTPATTAGADA